ncbi:MAG: gamma-glutamyltransferase family protein [Thermoleophilia bacterium]|nr:gamma-glutamyltransferase family protein [Thermoleophilia bacterium]
MVGSTHWLASAAGMAVLERGGNAFDAAVAAGFTLQVVEPHLNGPGGEVPAVFFPVSRDEPVALCGQGVAPAAATIERYHELGHELVPGTGVLAACVPGAFGGWLLLLEQFGTWRLADVLEFAIGYAENGFPIAAGIRATIDRTEELLRTWPASADLYLPAPEVGALFRNPALAATYRRIVDESRGGAREEEIERARRCWYEGFVAEEIDRFVAAEGGLLTADDLAAWRASLEPVARFDYRGLTVCKTLPWGAGPVALQQLALLAGFDLGELSEAEFVHVVTECAKLAHADRDALYGDAEVPLETLLSKDYNDERRRLVGEEAAGDYVPGLGHLPRLVEAAVTAGAGEPTRGDTVHLDVVDRWGNMLSATPSGGWLHSSPVIPALGWPLGTRAQMFWLEEGLPSSLRPGARPRTTLSPGLALRDDGSPYLAWGTPGGDQQEQWALHVFLRHVDQGHDLQAAIDAPDFHTDHLISSFYPRGFVRRALSVEERFGSEVIDDLRRRGHEVEVTPAWSLGRVSAVAREPGGLLKAGANPRGMQGYAAGR